MRYRAPIWAMGIVAATALILGPSSVVRAGSANASEPRRLVLHPGWTQVSDVPLSPRTDASVVEARSKVVVFGGDPMRCPPNGICVRREPMLADGAVLDLKTGRWRSIADAPGGFSNARTARIGHVLYVLAWCWVGPTTCGAPSPLSMYRYDLAQDAWTTVPVPPHNALSNLTVVAGELVATTLSDETGEVPDSRFDRSTSTWVPIPDDPLPPVFDRQAVAHRRNLIVVGTPLAGSTSKVMASFDLRTGAWSEPVDVGRMGWNLWRAGDRAVLNPHYRSGDDAGGVLDLETLTWTPLPNGPEPLWGGDMAGVIGRSESTFAQAGGWVLDVTRGEWVEVPPPPGSDGAFGVAVTGTPAGKLVAFGGQRWHDIHTNPIGELLGDLWIWSPSRS